MIPFLVRPGIQVESVGKPSIGVVTFLRMGDVAVLEDPASLQKKNDSSIASFLIMENVAERIAKDTGVELRYCRAKAFDVNPRRKLEAVEVVTVTSSTKAGVKLDVEKPLPVNTWLQLENDAIAIITAVKPSGDGFIYSVGGEGVTFKKGDTAVIRDISIDEYMTRDERVDQVKAGLDNATSIDEAVTYLIQNRVLYPVQLLTECKPSEKGLNAGPISFPLQPGDVIKFDNVSVTVRTAVETTSEVLDSQAIPIEAAAAKVEAGAIGYVMRDGQYLKGDPTWDSEKTRQVGEKLKAEIYAFYKKERAAAPTISDDDAPAAAGNGESKQITSEADPQ